AVVAADRRLVDRQRGALGVGVGAAERLVGGQAGLHGVVARVVGVVAVVLEAAAGAGADRVAGGARADDAGQVPTRGARLGHVLGAQVGGVDVDRVRGAASAAGGDRGDPPSFPTRRSSDLAVVAADRRLVD